MKSSINKLLSILIVGLILLPSSAFAKTTIIIESDTGNKKGRTEYVSSFLKDYSIIKNCLSNKANREKRDLTAGVALCSVLNVFSQDSNIRQSWKTGKKLKLVSRNTRFNQKLLAIDYLKLLFKASGLNISPISEQKYRKNFRKLRVRFPKGKENTLAIALNFGIIATPTTHAETKLLKKDLLSSITNAEAFGYLYQVASSQHDQAPYYNLSTTQSTPKESIELEGVLKEIIKTIKTESYFSSKFDEKKAMEKAIKALVKSLEEDKYMEYYTEEEYQNFSNSLNGNLEGIGAYIEEKEKKILIVSPIMGSPAEKAGLLPADIITHIDGESTENMNLQQAIDKIRGHKGTSVVLTINRKGKTLKISILRDKVTIPMLQTENKNGIEIIHFFQFGATSAAEMKNELIRIAKKQPKGLIIDLRNNPGGYLDQVISIVDYFISPENPIVYVQNHKIRQTVNSVREPIITNIPIAVLINKGSASASEILAGALQNYGIAKIYGETSYGKGTVQNIINLTSRNQNRNSAFKLTTAEYLIGGPKNEAISINGIGVVPDSNPPGKSPLIDNPDTVKDEAIDVLINTMK